MDFSDAAPKLIKLDVAQTYRSRTLDELNSLAEELDAHKVKLSSYIGWYLKNREGLKIEKPDYDRLCRALAFPDALADKVLMENDIYKKGGSIETQEMGKFVGGLASLKSFPFLVTAMQDLTIDISGKKMNAVSADVRELMVYASMYQDIGIAMSVGKDMGYFPRGNPFGHMIDIMSLGGLIVRFKYVSRDGSDPEEKVVSYHPVASVSGAELAVHIEGDKRFSMRKFWGQGDEALQPIEGRYKGTIVRWGKNDVRRARDGIEDKRNTFLY